MLTAMNMINVSDRAAANLLANQCDLITRSQALASGMSLAALRAKVRPGGRWTVVLPGIYFAHDGSLTMGQREMAAVLYGGAGSVITGQAALARRGVRISVSEFIDVLVPHDRRRQSVKFVRIHRTRRMPERPVLYDGLPWAPAARAVADAIREQSDLRYVRALVAAAVQQKKCTVEQLKEELLTGAAQGSLILRAVLDEVAAGAASIAECEFQDLVKASNLPEPMYNPSLYVGQEFLARPDAWWPDAGVAAEVDSREWHISPADWQKSLARHARMCAHGIIVLHLTPQRIRTAPAQVVADLRSAIDHGRQRAPLAIRAIPCRN
jgi:hypothetical protein